MSHSTEKLNQQYIVCANHFEDSQFMNPAMKNRLIHNAVPTIFDYQIYQQNSHPNPNFQSTILYPARHNSHVICVNRLCKSAEEYCKFLSCKQEKCSVRIRSMVKLYMKVRIHHALKMNNMDNSENKSEKHNRKMLKHTLSKHKIWF